MSKAIRFHEIGGPEVLRSEEIEVGEPGPGEARVRHGAIGVNFVDVYHRNGLYPAPLPSGLGSEAAGVVEAVGQGVSHVRAGDRVVYAGGPLGAYAQVRVMPADRLVRLPSDLSDRQAASAFLKGLTVQYLIRRTHVVKAGETVLFHSAAGGVGLIACQWLKAIGAMVIGTVGSDDKVARARAAGADHVIVRGSGEWSKRVRELTKGRGVRVVYDSIGASTFAESLDCLAPMGLLVSFGNASGPVQGVDLALLAQKGSLFVTRPTLTTYTARRDDLDRMASELFDVISSGEVSVAPAREYPLEAAAEAHRDLESGATMGASILLP